MNNDLLKASIESLKQIQLELHDDMDSSKKADLDKIILDLELYGCYKSKLQLIDLLGNAIKFIPFIERLVNDLIN